MPQTPSPLRYPGGKTSILNMVSEIIKSNGLERGHYAEPYAGGAGLALSLMLKGYVHELHLNDLDRSIWSFWDAVLNNTEQFVEKIIETPITMDEWYKQREVQENKGDSSDFDLAFSSFFLNRTNRSGIILKAGVIGGLEQQGKYKLDCRFNKKGLIEKIKRISNFSHRIHLYNCDAIDFLKLTNKSLPPLSFYCIDPPYFVKGASLYTNAYEPDDHRDVSKAIEELSHPWILTYDNVEAIQRLYPKKKQFRFNLNYSAAQKRVGTELLIASDNLIVPNGLNLVKAA
ncbi:DNA adenine methylase [Pseudoalteromonas fenneropenaei]|uniref:site-specific DNA-methyltransferase (adenine-specific) n=1 Tax=Pseudoalteromonas fenneropenaei TaxID=1737459 RepID=A0ABV7CKV9_9GAMM